MRLPGCWMHADRLKWYRVGIRHAGPDDCCGTKASGSMAYIEEYSLPGLPHVVVVPYLPGQLWETVGQTRGYECLRDAAFGYELVIGECTGQTPKSIMQWVPKVPLPPGPWSTEPHGGSHCHRPACSGTVVG